MFQCGKNRCAKSYKLLKRYGSHSSRDFTGYLEASVECIWKSCFKDTPLNSIFQFHCAGYVFWKRSVVSDELPHPHLGLPLLIFEGQIGKSNCLAVFLQLQNGSSLAQSDSRIGC